MILAIHAFVLSLFSLYTYGFIDTKFPYQPFLFLHNLVYSQRNVSLLIYSFFIVYLFGFYSWVLTGIVKKSISHSFLWKIVGITTIILFFSFPGFSNDIFNYIATAKVTYFYKENPYIVMPIEIPNEPMLAFLHASNKTALYGFVWILLTWIPHVLGFGNLFITVIAFKFFIICFYLGLIWLIYKISDHKHWSLAFFGLNPLVVVESLISAHNDVVMMFFALFSFYCLQKKRVVASLFFLLLSICIKFATVVLIPVYIIALLQTMNRKTIPWATIWLYACLCLYGIFFLSPLREELYQWYFIWPLTFASLLQSGSLLSRLSLAFSFGLSFRFAPFVYTRNWGGMTPLVKKIVSFVPPSGILLYELRKKV